MCVHVSIPHYCTCLVVEGESLLEGDLALLQTHHLHHTQRERVRISYL